MKKGSNTGRGKANNSSHSMLMIMLRYVFLLALALTVSFSDVLYQILLKLTIYPVAWLLNIFYSPIVYNNLILVESFTIEIIPACVALSAFMLLIILNFLTPMPSIKRVKSLLFSLILFLFLNIIRIFILSILLVEKFTYFDIVHKIFWYSLSIVIVLFVWFFTVRFYRIKEIPIYDDFRNIILLIKSQGRKSR